MDRKKYLEIIELLNERVRSQRKELKKLNQKIKQENPITYEKLGNVLEERQKTIDKKEKQAMDAGLSEFLKQACKKKTVDDDKYLKTLRFMAWAEAKGKLEAMLQTFWEDDLYEIIDEIVSNFLDEMEDKIYD